MNTQQQFQMPFGILPNFESGISDVLKENINIHIVCFLCMDNIIKAFKGTIKSVGSDYLILKDNTQETLYLIPFKNISYVTFDEGFSAKK